MTNVLLITLLCVICLPAFAGTATPPFVCAHYMHCFILGGMANKGQFNNGESPLRTGVDSSTEWPEFEQAMRGWWSPALAPLAQSGIEAVRKDLDMVGDAGVDALGLLISHTHLPHSQFAPGMRLVAQAAMTHHVKIYPDLWDGNLTAEQWQQYGEQVKTFMDTYPGAFLSYQGKPVISLGCPLGYGRGVARARGTKFDEWEAVKNFFTPWGGAEHCYKILNITGDAQDLTGGYSQAADAYSMWAATFGWGDRRNDSIAAQANLDGKAIAWPVNSSYFGGRKGCESMSETLGVSRYCDQWRSAIARHATFTAVQTWNDFSEDHYITDSNYRGRTLITLTRYFADWRHAGAPPKITREQVYLFHHRQLVEAKLSEATILAHNDKWHQTPTTDYLEVVTLLKEAGSVHLQVGEDTWMLDAPAGFHEWLVYVPSGQTASGEKKEAFNHGADSYPTTDANRTVTVATHISAGTPVATLTRGGHLLATVTSRLPLADAARWQDLSMVGTMATCQNDQPAVQDFSGDWHAATAVGNLTKAAAAEYTWLGAQEPERLQLVTDPLRRGNFSVRVEVRNGDVDKGRTDRCEFSCARHGAWQNGDEAWYALSVYFPAGFPLPPSWALFHQFFADDCAGHTGGSPPLALEVTPAGGTSLQIRGGEKASAADRAPRSVAYHLGPIAYGQWHDYLLHVKWSTGPEGLVEVWHRKAGQPWPAAPTARDTGSNVYTVGGVVLPVYAETGYYRGRQPETAILYHAGLWARATRTEAEKFFVDKAATDKFSGPVAPADNAIGQKR